MTDRTGWNEARVHLREIDAGMDCACWVVCAKGDPGAVEFAPTIRSLTREPEPGAEGVGEWRCFHCDEVFRDLETAREHFGLDRLDLSGCKLNAAEGGLLKIVREQAEELRRLRQEDTASCREFYSLGAKHSQALFREEEKGYARGLADMKSQGLCPEPSAHDVIPALSTPAAADGELVEARNALLDLRADASAWHEEIDGDVDSEGRKQIEVYYHVTVNEQHLRTLCEALGIEIAFDQTAGDALELAIEQSAAALSRKEQP